jgi:hypothetical protein
MAEFTIANVAGAVVTIAEVSGRHDPKSADGRQRPTLRSPQPIFAMARIVDDFAVTAARQVQAAREHLARVGGTVPRIAITAGPSGIVPIAMIGGVACVVPIVVASTFVMRLWSGTRAASKRQTVVILIPIALVSIAVAGVALIAVVAWIEVHHTSAEIVA